MRPVSELVSLEQSMILVNLTTFYTAKNSTEMTLEKV